MPAAASDPTLERVGPQPYRKESSFTSTVYGAPCTDPTDWTGRRPERSTKKRAHWEHEEAVFGRGNIFPVRYRKPRTQSQLPRDFHTYHSIVALPYPDKNSGMAMDATAVEVDRGGNGHGPGGRRKARDLLQGVANYMIVRRLGLQSRRTQPGVCRRPIK